MKTRTTSSMLTKTIAPVRNWLNRPPLRRGLPREQQLPRTQAMWIIRGFLLIPLALALACFALSQQAQAVGPDTDGAIPGSNNGEGTGVLVSLTGGIWNTGTGFEALNHLTSGNQNTATGLRALTNDTNGGFNTATGVLSLFSNINGFFNSATGAYSLAHNTDGNDNTANGYAALYYNDADKNTATGFAALYRNTAGDNNVADGYQALTDNTEGNLNVAVGSLALAANTTGSQNTAVGRRALQSSITSNHNTAIGHQALFDSTGADNTAIGKDAGMSITGNGNVVIGQGVVGDSGVDDTTWIRNVNTTIQPVVAGFDFVTVRISDGRLGRTGSSRRYKDDIKPMDKASEQLFALKPVTYRYKKEIDPTQTLDFGLIAEEVEKVNPELALRDKEGKPTDVRYTAINAMLLNEFIKEHHKVEDQARKVQEQEATIVELKKDLRTTVAQLTARLEEQAAQIQKVSAQLELSKRPPQVVRNNQ